MHIRIALLRGINVGGKNIVKMAPLRAALEDAGLTQVATYIQSGNIVAQSALDDASFGALIAKVIAKEFGVTTWPAVIDPAALARIIAAMEAGGDAAQAHALVSHAYVYRERPETPLDLSQLNGALGPDDRLTACPEALILYAPNGLSQSKFATKADRAIPVPVTCRNYRTLGKLLDMATAGVSA